MLGSLNFTLLETHACCLVLRDARQRRAPRDEVGWVSRPPYGLTAATHSISISMAGFGSATTTQVVRAGYGAGPKADA